MENLKKFEGKFVTFTWHGNTFVGKKVHFVGTNKVGHKVISFEAPSRGILYLDDWNDVTDMHETSSEEMHIVNFK